jgi:hypothetical protein
VPDNSTVFNERGVGKTTLTVHLRWLRRLAWVAILDPDQASASAFQRPMAGSRPVVVKVPLARWIVLAGAKAGSTSSDLPASANGRTHHQRS